jgi:hypothetical protein
MREICTLRSTWRGTETSCGSVREALKRKRGATDRPDLRVWRHSSTLPAIGRLRQLPRRCAPSLFQGGLLIWDKRQDLVLPFQART